MVHPTKKDAWLVLGITAVVLFLVGFGAYNLVTGARPPMKGWLLLGIGLFLAVVFYSFATYEITATDLVIRSQLYGIRFGSIPLDSIQEVFPTRNPLSAPAWSLDRLHIVYLKDGKKKFNLVSPKDKQAFLRELAEAAPGLRLEGDRIVRA
jgi:hypothetical protein